jgi:hypothetical protein
MGSTQPRKYNLLKLPLTSLTSGGRSVGIVHSWTKAIEFIIISSSSSI